jgi:hypothetical protein
MVDDSKYIIVPTTIGYSPSDQANELTDLVRDGYRIISKISTGLAVHYVLIKFKAGTRPVRTDDAATPITSTPKVDVAEDTDTPLDLDDIPF